MACCSLWGCVTLCWQQWGCEVLAFLCLVCSWISKCWMQAGLLGALCWGSVLWAVLVTVAL